jgi:cholest-4-en-3-one 26-monooxygenase
VSIEIDVLDPDLYGSGDPNRNGLPLDQLEYLRDHAPVFLQEMSDPMLVDRAWVISRYEDSVKVLKSTDVFNSLRGTSVRIINPTLAETGGKPAMVSMEGSEHSRNRRIVSRGFTPAVVRTFERHFRSLAADIVERALEQPEVDFVADVASTLPLYAICDLIGVPQEDRQQMLSWTNTFTVPTDPDYAASVDDVHAAIAGIWAYGVELAKRRRVEPTGDLMSTIVAAVDDEQLSEDELMGFMLTLTAAGNETTRNTLAHGLVALLQRPASMEWLRQRADNLPSSAVEEILRWSSPVIHSRRTASRQVEMHGETIRAGDAVVVLYPAANFDPRQFPNPLELDLSRTPNAHITFAVGPHVCLGAHVARLEVKILFEELLRRTKTIEWSGACEYARDSALRGVKRLPVRMVRA